MPFGYEEAIGFMFGSELRDKDGVAASVSPFSLSLSKLVLMHYAQVVFAEMVAALQRQGKTASTHLKELYEK